MKAMKLIRRVRREGNEDDRLEVGGIRDGAAAKERAEHPSMMIDELGLAGLGCLLRHLTVLKPSDEEL